MKAPRGVAAISYIHENEFTLKSNKNNNQMEEKTVRDKLNFILSHSAKIDDSVVFQNGFETSKHHIHNANTFSQNTNTNTETSRRREKKIEEM